MIIVNRKCYNDNGNDDMHTKSTMTHTAISSSSTMALYHENWTPWGKPLCMNILLLISLLECSIFCAYITHDYLKYVTYCLILNLVKYSKKC